MWSRARHASQRTVLTVPERLEHLSTLLATRICSPGVSGGALVSIDTALPLDIGEVREECGEVARRGSLRVCGRWHGDEEEGRGARGSSSEAHHDGVSGLLRSCGLYARVDI